MRSNILSNILPQAKTVDKVSVVLLDMHMQSVMAVAGDVPRWTFHGIVPTSRSLMYFDAVAYLAKNTPLFFIIRPVVALLC